MDKLRQEINRSEEAKRILDSEMFQAAEQGVRAAIMHKWATSPIADREGQHELRLMLKLLDDLLLNFKAALNDGVLARVEITRQSKVERMKRTWAA